MAHPTVNGLPATPLIDIDQTHQIHLGQPLINEALVGLRKMALSSDLHKGRICPKQVIPKHDAAERVLHNWQQLRLILGPDHPMLALPNEVFWPQKVHNEASARLWMDDYISRPAQKIWMAAANRIRQLDQGTVIPDLDPDFAQALRTIGRIWFEHERPTRFLSDMEIDPSAIAVDIANNPDFHRLFDTASDAPTSQSTDGSNDIVEQVVGNLIKPTTDIEFLLETFDSRYWSIYGLTFLLIEMKNPLALSADDLEGVIHVFKGYCSSPSLRALWDQNRSIFLRAAYYNNREHPLQPQACRVLGALIQAYHNMVFRKLTYGLLSSVAASLIIEIDWNHPDHPGQIVKVATHNLQRRLIQSLSPDNNTGPPPPISLLQVVVGLGLEQMICGPVDDERLQRLKDDMLMYQDTYLAGIDGDESSQDDDDDLDQHQDPEDEDLDPGNSDNQGKDDGSSQFDQEEQDGEKDREGRHQRRGARKYRRAQSGRRTDTSSPTSTLSLPSSASFSCASMVKTTTRAAYASTSSKLAAESMRKPSKGDPSYVKLLDAVKVPRARAELEKLIESIEDPRYCATFEPDQLGRLLCALFPLRVCSSRQRRCTPSPKPKDGKSKPEPEHRSAKRNTMFYSARYMRNNASRAVRFPFHKSDLDLLQPRTLFSGPVSIEFNRRLAYSDDPELAERMVAEEDGKQVEEMLPQDSCLSSRDGTDDKDGSGRHDPQLPSSSQDNSTTSKRLLVKQSEAGQVDDPSSKRPTQANLSSRTFNASNLAESLEEAQTGGRDLTLCDEFDQSDTPCLKADTSLEGDDVSLGNPSSPQADSILVGATVRFGEHRDHASESSEEELAFPKRDELSIHPVELQHNDSDDHNLVAATTHVGAAVNDH
ncbi:hypothetical protein NDA10_005038 [Ustilago hordei]|nr:hypothetical protein NDA10_005038 [Ustilago hordei]